MWDTQDGQPFQTRSWPAYIQVDVVKPVFNNSPPGWILTVAKYDNPESEELVVRLQGVIVQSELPPVTVRWEQGRITVYGY